LEEYPHMIVVTKSSSEPKFGKEKGRYPRR
jgi:hypothetical protein